MKPSTHTVALVVLALAGLLGGVRAGAPSACSLAVTVAVDDAQVAWFKQAPEIRGTVTLSNPTSNYAFVSAIVVQARSSDGLLYTAPDTCGAGGSATMVRARVAGSGDGTARCTFSIPLDLRVFGRYAQPSNSSISSGFFFLPARDKRPEWSVAAAATLSPNGTRCESAPARVDSTGVWYIWLQSWLQKQHPGLKVINGPDDRGRGGWSGRKLLAAGAPAR